MEMKRTLNYEKGDVYLYGEEVFSLEEVEILELSNTAYCVRLNGGRGWVPLKVFQERVFAKLGKATYRKFWFFTIRRVVIT